MQSNLNLHLESRRTWVQHVKTFLWATIGGIEVYVGVGRLLTGRIGIWGSLFVLTLGFLMMYGATTRVTDNYRILADTLEIRAWNKERFIVWVDVTEVDIVPTFFSEPNMAVRTAENRPEVISTSHFANAKLLNQAVVEAAHMHNSKVKIGKFALGMYGPPPYGIFTDQKADS